MGNSAGFWRAGIAMAKDTTSALGVRVLEKCMTRVTEGGEDP